MPTQNATATYGSSAVPTKRLVFPPRGSDKAILQRKLLLWGLKPVEAPLSEISDITIDAAVDRASGVEVCHTMLIMRGGTGWAFPAADKTEAETNAAAMRHFLAITG